MSQERAAARAHEEHASCAQLRRIAGMVVNLGSTFIKRIELAKKMYGITPENNIARPAGDLRTPHERDIQFRSCCWSGGVFLGNAGDELDSASWERQGGLSGTDGESGSGCSVYETPKEGMGTIRDASLGGSAPQTCATDSEIRKRTNLSVSAA